MAVGERLNRHARHRDREPSLTYLKRNERHFVGTFAPAADASLANETLPVSGFGSDPAMDGSSIRLHAIKSLSQLFTQTHTETIVCPLRHSHEQPTSFSAHSSSADAITSDQWGRERNVDLLLNFTLENRCSR